MIFSRLQPRAATIVETAWFRHGVTTIILINAIVVGLDTSKYLHEHFGDVFQMIYQVILALFVLEAIVKLLAVYPRLQDYFRDGWNFFDFTVIVFSLIPTTGYFAMLARLARVFRVLRLISTMPQLRILVNALVRTIPGMFNIMLLMSIIFYVYGVSGYHLFHEIDPTHWRTLGISLLSLVRIVTFDDWAKIMYIAMDHFWWAWVFFLSFVVIQVFVVINLFIGIVTTNIQEAREAHLAEQEEALGTNEVVEELKRTRRALKRVQDLLQQRA